MNQKYRWLKYSLYIGIPLGLVALVVSIIYKIPEKSIFQFFIGLLAIASCVIVAVNFILIFSFRYRLKKLSQIISVKKDLDGFITETKRCIKNTKIKNFQSVLFMGMAEAYTYKKEYEKSNEILLSINETTLNGIQKAYYYALIALNFYFQSQFESGNNVLKEQNTVISKYENEKAAGGVIALAMAFRCFFYKEKVQCQDYINKAKAFDLDGYISDFGVQLQQKID